MQKNPRTGRIAVVTGAASGIGQTVARRLHADGWSVVGLDLAFPAEGRHAADRHLELACDVGSEASVQAAFERIDRDVGVPDALVCSAGIARLGSLADLSVADFDATYAVNTRGPWLCAIHAIRLMRREPRPDDERRIVFVGSVSGLRPKVGNGAYSAQKAALHVITGVLAAELGSERILVNAVAPGTVDTPMVRAVGPASQTGLFRPSGTSPLGRIAVPDDVADVIEFFLGEQSRYVTGTVLPVDGGTRAAFIAAKSG